MAYLTKANANGKTIRLGGTNRDGTVNETSIEGYYLGSRETPDSGYGPGTLHDFQTAEGTVSVWGRTNINRLLGNSNVGQMCCLTFTGMGKAQKGKSPAYEYKLQYDPSNTIDPGTVEANAPVSAFDDEEEEDLDVIVPPRAKAPSKPARVASQAEVDALHASRRTR